MDSGRNTAESISTSASWSPSSVAFLETTLAEILDAAIAVSSADFGSFQLIEPATSDLTIVAQRGLPDWWLQFWNEASHGRGSGGTALELGQRVIIEDVEDSPLFVDPAALEVQSRAGVRAIQSTPVFARSGRSLGVFSTHYRTRCRPDANALVLLDLLGRHAGDLIERALAEQALTEREGRYASIFRLSPVAIALATTADGVLLDVNEAFLTLFELTREETIGKTGMELQIVDTDLRDRARAELQAHGSVRDFECVVRSKSGAQRVLWLHVNRIVVGGTDHILSTPIDVTKRHEDERRQRVLTDQLTDLNRSLERRVRERTDELSRAQDAAEAASRAKSAFLSSMSHEMRTPLNSLLGFAQLMRLDKKAPLNERQQDKIDRVLRSGEHLLHLIDDVLDLARIEAGGVTVSPEAICIADVLSEVGATLGPMASRHAIDLAIEPPPPDVPRVVADRARLAQILTHYGSNAIKYGKEGGRATITTSALGDHHVRVAVRDDGVGIPEAKQSSIFQPFERAGRETGPIEGAGIGLAITKQLANLMQVRVGFHSVAGEGSTFWIDLPVCAETPASPEPHSSTAIHRPSPTTGATPGRRRTILYVEADPADAGSMHELVEALEEFELITAPTPEAGIEHIQRRRPDILVMDLSVAKTSGWDAMQRLRQWAIVEDVPAIALTAAAVPDQRQEALDAGFLRCLTKPVDAEELSNILNAVPR